MCWTIILVSLYTHAVARDILLHQDNGSLVHFARIVKQLQEVTMV